MGANQIILALLRIAAILLLLASFAPMAAFGAEDLPQGLPPAKLTEREETNTERFKEFLSNPPPLQEIIFRRKVLGEIERPRPADGSFSRSTNFLFYAGQRAPDSMVLRIERSPVRLDSPKPGRELYAIVNGEHWIIEERNRQAYLWVKPDLPTLNSSNTVQNTIHFRVRHFFQCLNFGISHVSPATINWIDDRFELTIDERRGGALRIRGELQVDAARNRPEGMRVNYQSETSSVDYLVRFYYEKPLAFDYLPNRFKTYLLKNGMEIEYEDFTILEMQVDRDAPLLAIRDLVFANDYDFLTRTNGALYAVERSGEVRFIQEIKETSENHRGQRRMKLAQIYTGFGLANIGIFILAARMKRKSHAATNKE